MTTIKKERILTILSDEGIFILSKKILKYLKSKMFQISKELIFELDLEKCVPRADSKIELSLRWGSKEDIDSMNEENYGYDQHGKNYSKERLDKGDKFLLALHNGKIVGYIWAMKDKMELSEFNHISLPFNRVYTYNTFVLKEYRGKRVQGAMYTYLINTLRRDGKRFAVDLTNTNNKSALEIKNKYRGEFKIIGRVIQIRFLGLKYDYINKKDLKYLQSP